jgi:hypothetical protein
MRYPIKKRSYKMPRITLIPGAIGNFGANTIPGDLAISAPFGATFTATLGAGAAVPYALGLGGIAVVAVNNAAISINNTTVGIVHPPAGNIILIY